MKLIKRLSLYIFLALLGYVPLHIFLSTWVGTSLNILEPAKVAKDVVLIIGFLCALAASVREPWFKQLLNNKLVWLISAYSLWTVLLAIVWPTDTDAEILGVVYNLRFLVIFIYGLILSRLFETQYLKRLVVTVVLAVSAVVMFFGVVQYTVLPDNALAKVGYSRVNGVLPAFFIDDKPDLERVMSTLRDPNSFGSYIIIIGMLSLAFLIRKKVPRQSAIGLLALGGMCLVFTFSRSAWLGFAIAGGFMLIYAYKTRLYKSFRTHFALIAACVLLGGAAVYSLRNTYLVQNVIFHADETTVLENPNQLRVKFWKESTQEIANNPLGHGPGTAGLASIRNDVQGTTLNENYYLQIGHEVGIVGLALFLAILSLVGWRLLEIAKSSTLALGILAAFLGLAFTNGLVHIWSNEAVAYTWWGLASLVILSQSKKIEKF